VSGGNDDRQALRAVVISALGTIGDDEEVVRQSRAALDRALAGNGSALEPTLRESVVEIAAEHGDEKLYEALNAAAARATAPDERNLYLLAAAKFRDPRLIGRALQRVFSNDVRTQDTARYLAAFFGNPVARPQAWSFIKANWTQLEPRLRIFNAGARIASALDAFCDSGSRDDIRMFFDTHRLPGMDGALNRTIESINNCIDLREKQTKPVGEWLSQRQD
jgi:aminopeptidase N